MPHCHNGLIFPAVLHFLKMREIRAEKMFGAVGSTTRGGKVGPEIAKETTKTEFRGFGQNVLP
jgi:hypothetical protein